MIANWVVPLNVLLVALSTAEHNCGENEKWTECTGCELSCGQDEDTPCTANCRPPSCYCAPYDNLRRDPDGKCIPNEQCPQTDETKTKRETQQCAENEQWSNCRGCEGTCEQQFVMCTRMCRPPGCECNAGAGFVRHGGKCIRFSDCPPKR